jgi:hypothetical protein
VGTAHAIERVARPLIVRRAPLPTLRISLPPISLFFVFLFLFLFLFLSPYSLFAFPIRHPDEGMAERR